MICPGCGTQNDDSSAACGACDTPLPRTVEIKPGFVVAGRYEIQRLLGKGGMGAVYLAYDRLLKEAVAFKVLRPDVAQSGKEAQRFLSEIKLARAVSHKNVCRIHEYGEDHGLRYISMAHVDGDDLKQLLRARGAFATEQAFEIAIHVADGLHAIHEEGIVHRDLKTPNIMMDRRGVVRLMDFGIAKQSDTDAESMTATGTIVGTPEYMSPEQVRGLKLDRRSDVYSLGIVVYELFTGHTPFRGDTPLSTILKHLQEPPPLESADLPPPLVPVLARALAKDRDHRYSSARELAAALLAAQAEWAAAPGPTGTVSTAGLRQGTAATAAVKPSRTAATAVVKPSPALPAGVGVRPEAPGARALWAAGATLVVLGGAAGFLMLRAPRADPVASPGVGPASPGTSAPSAPTSQSAAPPATQPTPGDVQPTSAPLPSAARTNRPSARPPPQATPSPPALDSPPPTTTAVVMRGTLLVRVVPFADITVDGQPQVAGRLQLSIGRHEVRLVHPDYKPIVRTVTIRAGEVTELPIDFAEDGLRQR